MWSLTMGVQRAFSAFTTKNRNVKPMPKLSEMSDLVGIIIDAIPSPIFIVDNDVRIIGSNQAASRLSAKEPKTILRKRAGDILHCVHSTETTEGCGGAESCKDCLIRKLVNESFNGNKVIRQQVKMEFVTENNAVNAYMLVTTAPFIFQHKPLVLLILEDISELIRLKSILPICSSCKKIRDDKGNWQPIEKYIGDRSEAEFSHGICPDCVQKLYPQFYEQK